MEFYEKQKIEEKGIENYRNLKGYWLIIINILAISLSLFHLYTSGFGLLPALKLRAFHLMLLTPLALSGLVLFIYIRKTGIRIK